MEEFLRRNFDIRMGRLLGPRLRQGLGGSTEGGYLPKSSPGIVSAAKPPLTVPQAIGGSVSKLVGRGLLPYAIYEQSKQVFNPNDNIITRSQNLIRSIQDLSRPNPAATKPESAAPTDAELRKEGYGFGVREYDPLERGVRPAGYIQYGTRDGVTPDRRQSDTYKQYAMTAPGQFERYFKTPEFDYAFGAQSGKGPKSPEEMAALAAQSKAPTTESLSDYYRSQSAMGRVNQAEIQKMYADRPDLQKWAAANPMLAQRELVKRQGGRFVAADQETVMGDLGTRAQAETGYTPQAFGLPANPVPPTQQPGPGGMDQGTRVSFFRGADEIAPQQAMKTTGEGMPQFQTTLSKAEDFLRKF